MKAVEYYYGLVSLYSYLGTWPTARSCASVTSTAGAGVEADAARGGAQRLPVSRPR